jgi:hypothetical protein
LAMHDARSEATLGVMLPRWPIALVGLFLSTFSLLALSGPGRIDILDGQTRYEVARSLAEHGDSAIRDPHVWFGVFPGAGGLNYTYYRFPHSVLGVPAIWIADSLGTISEARRHFYFVLVSAAAGALLAVVFAVAFRDQGLSESASILWGLSGILCTPCWYYSTSTFDEIFGSLTLVATIVAASRARVRVSTAWTVVASLLLALACNWKQPLGAFVLLALAVADDPTHSRSPRLCRAAWLLGGVALGVALHFGYYWLKFPPGQTPDHSELLKQYTAIYGSDPLSALFALAVSPGAGVLWYAPAFLLTIAGLREHWNRSACAAWAGLASSLAFLGFIVTLTFFKGDLCWGPRYLTPLLALGWLLAPAGAERLPRAITWAVLFAAASVQLLGLSVDPHRLYLEHRLPGTVLAPQLYFQPKIAHLIQRPREIVEVIQSDLAATSEFTPSWSPTAAPIAFEWIPLDDRGPRQYVIFDTLRPWWANQRYLPVDKRPVDPQTTLGLMAALLVFGGILLVFGLRACGATFEQEST